MSSRLNETSRRCVNITVMRKALYILLALAALSLAAAVEQSIPNSTPMEPRDPAVVSYDAAMPNIQCLDGRVIAETSPALDL